MAQGHGDGGYSFAQPPRAVSARKKFRDPATIVDERLAVNIMWDRRVVRGNTYAAAVLPAVRILPANLQLLTRACARSPCADITGVLRVASPS